MSHLPQVGLDIGSASIKVVELAPGRGDKWRLLTAASVATASEISEKTNIADMARIMAKIVREAGVRSKHAVISLPEEKVSTHLIELPHLPDNEIEQALQWQVEQYIPIPMEQAVWSYQVVSKDEIGGKIEILLVAASKSLIETYRQVIEMAGLEAVAFETELIATARAVLLPTAPLSVVVDIGAHGTDIGLVRSGVLMFARTIPTAGEAFTRSIESALGLDRAQAENYKNTYGFSAQQLEGKLLVAMKPVLDIIIAEVKKTIDFFTAKHHGEAIKSVVVSGGVAALPDVVSALSAGIGMEVVVANPLLQVEIDANQAIALKGHEPFYSVALGLAQRRND